MAVDPVSLAVTVALTAAQMAMQASQHYEGARVTDLNATVADYGTPLNYFYGRRWLTLPCPYAEDIRERKKRRKTKGGKFTEYTYFGTWVAHIADHPISRVRKIKFDGHLVYDIEASEQLFELDDDYELEDAVSFYLGTLDQMPDPRIEASIEAEWGPGTCPAWRGQSYIVFKDIPLEKVGNRLPIVTAEVETVSEAVSGDVVLDFVAGSYTIGGTAYPLASLIEPSDHSGSDFEYTDIVEGTGWIIPPGHAYSSADLTDLVTSHLGIGNEISAEIEFSIDLGNANSAYEGAGISFKKIAAGFPTNEIGAEAFVRYDEDGFSGYTYVNGAFGAYPVEAGLTADTVYTANIVLSNTDVAITLPPGTSSTSRADFTPADIAIANYRTTTALLPNSTAVIRKVTLTGPEVASGSVTLSDIMTDLSQRAGLSADDYDYTALAAIPVDGFNWTQGSVKQIAGPLMDVYDFDIRPHDFRIEAILRGSAPTGTIAELAKAEPRHVLEVTADSDLPRRVFFNFADVDSDQQTNTATAQRRVGEVNSSREMTLDLSTLALSFTDARRYNDRFLRRQWFGRTSGQNTLTRRDLAVEPGDVADVVFDDVTLTMVCTKLTIGADGTMPAEWRSDVPGLAQTTSLPGAPAAGMPPATIYQASDTTGAVLDLPLLIDAHDQTAPIAYVVAGPTDPAKAWPGADFAQSDTGDTETYATEWESVGSTFASEIGTVTDQLPDALPWVMDNGSSVEVVLQSGELTSTTDAALFEDGTLNLALIGDEIVQFRTATLIAPFTYTLSGFLRGRRGTEWAMAGHGTGERFVALGAAKKHVMGAGEIGDTDSYIAHTVGKAPKEANAFAVPFTGASHKPYAPINPVLTQDGSDWLIDATRRTRVGGASLNGQDVPLGETGEAWSLDILDGATVVRTLTGTSLPITYSAADQTTDFGAPLGAAPNGRLYQVNPALSLRGYPLEF